MGDWADEVAAAMFKRAWDVEAAEIATAIRQARADALEEVAVRFDAFGDDAFTASAIAAAIRTLKDKSACG